MPDTTTPPAISLDELASKVEAMEAENQRLRGLLTQPPQDQTEALGEALGRGLLAADEVKADRARHRRKAAYQRRLDAQKRPYIFRGRSVCIPRKQKEGHEVLSSTVTERRGDKLKFDPGDGDGQRTFVYGQTMHLSERDLTALRKAGYSLQDPKVKQEVPEADHIGRAVKAIEDGDYQEAVAVLRAENFMPHDEKGNVVKTKTEVFERLGEWIDDQRG